MRRTLHQSGQTFSTVPKDDKTVCMYKKCQCGDARPASNYVERCINMPYIHKPTQGEHRDGRRTLRPPRLCGCKKVWPTHDAWPESNYAERCITIQYIPEKYTGRAPRRQARDVSAASLWLQKSVWPMHDAWPASS